MRRLEHCNIVKLKYFFYSCGDKASFNLLIYYSSIDLFKMIIRILIIMLFGLLVLFIYYFLFVPPLPTER